ncbi:MAG: response regulator transcription factor [Candidatus Kapabacteria bacterium]|nr:response regulator transcription factor [Candidatus Kapabacteria bacterium]
MRILIIEDDDKIANAISRGLTDQHYSVDMTDDGSEGEFMAKTNDYDLIILDIMLPKRNGFDVCKSIRNEGILTPILMLTALDSVDNKIKGLDFGADDYLTKPFHLGELLARIRSLVRRQSESKTSVIIIHDLEMDTANREVKRAGKKINLSSKEFALLEYFILNKNKVLTRQMITEHVWDMNFDPQSNVIDSFVRFLRAKIDKDFDQALIQTIRGVGYKFGIQ